MDGGAEDRALRPLWRGRAGLTPEEQLMLFTKPRRQSMWAGGEEEDQEEASEDEDLGTTSGEDEEVEVGRGECGPYGSDDDDASSARTSSDEEGDERRGVRARGGGCGCGP